MQFGAIIVAIKDFDPLNGNDLLSRIRRNQRQLCSVYVKSSDIINEVARIKSACLFILSVIFYAFYIR